MSPKENKFIYLFIMIALLFIGFYLYKSTFLNKSRLNYINSQYGFEIKFPPAIKTYEKVEYPWPSHEKAYNPLSEINFATSKDGFIDGDSFYLSTDNPVKMGDILNVSIFDLSFCSDKKTDDYEKDF